MAFTSEMFDELRALLNDDTDTQITFAQKKLFLNRGIVRMWPRIWAESQPDTLTIVAGTQDYDFPGTDYILTSVEIQTEVGGTDYERFIGYDIITADAQTDGTFRFYGDTTALAGREIRFRHLVPPAGITAANYAAAQSELWLGTGRHVAIPPLYAMGMITARKLDDRQETLRYSTTVAMNGVSDTDIMTAANFWFSEFEAAVNDAMRPLPIAKD